MKANFIITDKLTNFSGYRIAEIDGQKANTLRNFYEEIAKALEFPEYFGFNLDSLDELLNDLSWLEYKKIAVFIKNSENFIEKERNPEKVETLLDLLEATCEDWNWTDEEDLDFDKKELKFLFSPSERITKVLENQGVTYEVLV